MVPVFFFWSPPQKRGSRAAGTERAALGARFRGHDEKKVRVPSVEFIPPARGLSLIFVRGEAPSAKHHP